MAARPRKRKRRHPATKTATTPPKRKRVRVAAKAKPKSKTKAKPARKPPVKSAPARKPKPAPLPKRKPTAKRVAPPRKPKLPITPRRPSAALPTRGKPALSRNPEAIRSRRRRLEAKSIADGLKARKIAKERERLARAKAARKRKKQLGRPLTDQERAASWLEKIREHCAAVFVTSLEITFPGGGHADLRDAHDQHLASQNRSHLWLAVGRFEATEEAIGYAEIAEALMHVRGDLILETRIGADRLTQIRIVFHDKVSGRSESDSVVSKIGGYEFVIGDVIGELVGSDVDSPDADSLAARYESTTIPKFYVYFGSEQIRFEKVNFGPRAQEIRLR